MGHDPLQLADGFDGKKTPWEFHSQRNAGGDGGNPLEMFTESGRLCGRRLQKSFHLKWFRDARFPAPTIANAIRNLS